MKSTPATLLLLFVAVLLTGCAATELPTRTDAELPSAEPFQGANVILIQTDNAPEEVRERVVQMLRLQDYEITQRTLQSETIVTEPRTFGSGTPGSARYYFDIPQEAGQPLRMYGEYVAQQTTDSQSFQQFQSNRVMPRGDRRSTSWLAWLEMDEMVSAYGSGEVMYDRE